MDMQQMPPEGESPEAPEQEAGTEICIAIKAGGMEVYVEQGGEETDRQPVADIGQALKAVLELYRSTQSAGEQQDFASGFARERGTEPKAPGMGGMGGGMR